MKQILAAILISALIVGCKETPVSAEREPSSADIAKLKLEIIDIRQGAEIYLQKNFPGVEPKHVSDGLKWLDKSKSRLESVAAVFPESHAGHVAATRLMANLSSNRDLLAAALEEPFSASYAKLELDTRAESVEAAAEDGLEILR